MRTATEAKRMTAEAREAEQNAITNQAAEVCENAISDAITTAAERGEESTRYNASGAAFALKYEIRKHLVSNGYSVKLLDNGEIVISWRA